MTNINYWLMKSDPVVIARVFENQINSVHTSSTLFFKKNSKLVDIFLKKLYSLNKQIRFGVSLKKLTRELSRFGVSLTLKSKT